MPQFPPPPPPIITPLRPCDEVAGCGGIVTFASKPTCPKDWLLLSSAEYGPICVKHIRIPTAK